jgi:cell wall-associated NlpC family hydrolase
LRNQVTAIDRIWQKQKVDTDLEDRDLHAIAVGARDAIAVTMQVREGRVIARQEFYMTVSLQTLKCEVMNGFLTQYYSDNPNPPREILVSILPNDFEHIEKFVSEKRGARVEMKAPERGDKFDLIQMVERNAELLLSDVVCQKKKVQLPFGIIELEKELHLKKTPRTIEAIDISHLGGTQAVGSLVTFRDGKKYGHGYRRYRIKWSGGGDDYSSIYEVVSRRINRIKEEGIALPDLLLIDGGKGQLSAAKKALAENNATDEVELASIAKRLEEVFRPGFENPFMLPKTSAGLRLLVKIRNEAHRFANEYQRLRRTENFRAKELTSISGIGEKRQKNLLKNFQSIEEIADSTPEIVAEKGKFPIEIAKKVIEALSAYRSVAVLLLVFIFSFAGCVPSPRYLGNGRPVAVSTQENSKTQSEKSKEEKKAVVESKTKKTELKKPEKEQAKNRENKTAPKSESTSIPRNKKSEAMMGTINLYLGTPYKYGGEDFSGIDCSGFVRNVYREVGVDLPRSSREMFVVGEKTSEPEFGDLVFFHCESRSVDHVGICLGDRKFAHSSTRLGVTIDYLEEPYYKRRYLGARKIE